MTSTPVSLNDESLNDSWIDINSASQIHSPKDEDDLGPEFRRPPHSLAESVQNHLGLMSFQVERFLQEAQRNQHNNNNNSSNNNLNIPESSGLQNQALDDNSGIYSSDTDVSVDGFDFRALITRKIHHQNQETKEAASNNDIGDGGLKRGLSRSRDCLVDQLSDSLSILSRASAMGEKTPASLHDFDWLWDWTAQPEYFAGKEWKGGSQVSKQDYLMRQRQLYACSSELNKSHSDGTLFSGEVISLLFLTNILSIIIGAGLTYSMLMRRSI